MTETRRPLIAGNWKMNGLKASANELAAIGQGADKVWRKADLLICPPATLLFTSAAIWTTLGLASGLFYREFTRQRDFTGFTQLSVAHTHALALGTIILLVALALTKLFALDADRRLRWFLLFWNAGLALTFTMMLVKGSLQVLGATFADSPMIAFSI